MSTTTLTNPLPALDAEPRALYLHIPFCAHKCGYCDFASLANADDLTERYLAALDLEIEMSLGTSRPQVETIFIGGGTPTRLTPEQLRRLLQSVNERFEINPDAEWTVEANPGTLDEAKVEALTENGVNRVSLGAQSFQPPVLKALERDHDPAEIPRAVALIRPFFRSWSLDLIFGAPGSTLTQWRRDLEHALELEPPHLSCYGLVYEKGTSLWKQWHEGKVRAVDQEVERSMYELTIDRLHDAGLRQYEISNFANDGHESIHNSIYWINAPYFGFGLGATRYFRGRRESNTRDLMAYLRRIESGESAIGPTESLEPEARARETAILMLRRTRLGIQRDDFLQRTGFEIEALGGETIRQSVAKGWLVDDGSRIRFTREGLFFADTIMADLV